MANVHYQQCARSSAHVQQFKFYHSFPRPTYSDPRPRLPSQSAQLGTFSFGHKIHLELARGLACTSHVRPPPPRDEGAHVLFSRPLKGASQVLLSPRVDFSSTLVNVRGRHIVLIPIFFSSCCPVPAVETCPRFIRCSSIMLCFFIVYDRP